MVTSNTSVDRIIVIHSKVKVSRDELVFFFFTSKAKKKKWKRKILSLVEDRLQS